VVVVAALEENGIGIKLVGGVVLGESNREKRN